MPQRIQLSRRKGWRKPEGAVVVARPSRWGNPWKVGDPSAYWAGPGQFSLHRPDPVPTMDAFTVVSIYEAALFAGVLEVTMDDVRKQLAGHDLACWCPLDQPCHADVLLKFANPKETP